MMRRILLASSVLASVALVGAAPRATSDSPQPQTPTFRTGTQVVPVFATVLDAQGRLVPDLTQGDFQIFDNGKLQTITQFSSETQPITVVVMLDTSASMTLSLDLLKKAAEQFLLRLLPDDRALVGAFNDKIQFASEFTGDRDALIRSLDDLQFGNPTRLYDAIDASLDELRGIEGRRVVLVFTDGDDTASKIGLGRVLERAREDEVMVYAIGLESEMNFNGRRVRTRPDRGLKRLADEKAKGRRLGDQPNGTSSTSSDAALAFINFILQPEMIARNSNQTRYANAVPASKPYLDPAILNDPAILPPPAVMEKLFVATPTDQKLQRVVTGLWNRVRTGK